MKASEKIKDLKRNIADALLPEIKGHKTVLLDVPYYYNIGDTLIWQGTHDFLKGNGIRCVLTSSKESFDFRRLPSDYVILLQGGGNFGDIWIEHQKFREKVISAYPDNKIIILPQTIFFENEDNLIQDAERLSKHKNLLIIARDNHSLDILEKYYNRNRILLLPDMAFWIDFKNFRVPKPSRDRILFFERRDVESNHTYKYGEIVPLCAERHEWPIMESGDNTWRTRWMKRVQYRLPRLYDSYWNHVLRKYFVQIGIDFIAGYKSVFTTRLHGAILSFLLDKDITLFDNSYGKNSSFYRTWLNDVDGIKLIPTIPIDKNGQD